MCGTTTPRCSTKSAARLQLTLSCGLGWAGEAAAVRSHCSSLQVSNPHDCDGAALVKCLLFSIFIAGPDIIFLSHPALPLLVDPHLPFEDMTNHRVHHRRGIGLGAGLHDDVTHRDGLEPGYERISRRIAVTPHDNARPRGLILGPDCPSGLRSSRLDDRRRSGSEPDC